MKKQEIKFYTILFQILIDLRFNNCKNLKSLPFDFYLPKNNTCIEFNGRQHYEPIDYFGGKQSFIEQQKRDNLKKTFCSQNNINLIIIKYNNDVEDIIKNQLRTIA